MYKYKILKISQVIDSEKEFIRKDTEEKLFKYATTKIRNFITDNFKKEKYSLFVVGKKRTRWFKNRRIIS